MSSVATRAPSAIGSARGETDLGGLFQIIVRHRLKVAGSIIGCVAAALAYLALATPVYTASASLFIDPTTRRVISEDVVQSGYGSDLALVESQVAILTSDAVLQRVIDKLNLANDSEYAPPPGQGGLLSRVKALVIPPAGTTDANVLALTSLANSIKVKRAAKTYVVDVEVSASSGAKAAEVAGAVAEAYLGDQTSAKAAEAKRANSLLDARLGELREQVREAEVRIDEFKKANKILSSDGGIQTEQLLSKIGSELITARAVAAESKARQDQIATALRSGATADTLPDAIRSGLIQKLREQYSQVARREAALSSQLQSRHPVLIDVRSQLAEVKTQIDAELRRISTATQSEFQIAANREREVSKQLEKAKEDVSRSNTAQIKMRELEQDANASRELLKTFLVRAKETAEQQNVSTPDARIITPPTVPSRPSKPIGALVLALGLLGGLGLGLASALASDYMDGALQTLGDLKSLTGVASVSAIPRHAPSIGLPFEGWRRRSDHGDIINPGDYRPLLDALSDSRSANSAYRQSVLRLLTRIKNSQRPGRPHTVAFVAPHGDAGNSATAIAVAFSAAIGGDRVLLVDATSSDASVSHVFASRLEVKGPVVLDSKEHLTRITTEDKASGLTVLPIALADLRTLKTQQRRRLVAGLNTLSQGFDLVVIDAGRLLEDEAATCLLPAADQIVLVARAGMTARDDIRHTVELLGPDVERLNIAVLTMSDASIA